MAMAAFITNSTKNNIIEIFKKRIKREISIPTYPINITSTYHSDIHTLLALLALDTYPE